jgi:hypothetical protein
MKSHEGAESSWVKTAKGILPRNRVCYQSRKEKQSDGSQRDRYLLFRYLLFQLQILHEVRANASFFLCNLDMDPWMDAVCIALVAQLWAGYMATHHTPGDMRESVCAGISQGHPIPVRERGEGEGGKWR